MKDTKMVRIEVDPHKLLDQEYFNEVIELLNEVKNKYNYEAHPRIVDEESQKMVLVKQVRQPVAKVKPVETLHEVANDVLYTATGKEINPIKLTSGKSSKITNTIPSGRNTIGENAFKEFVIHYLKENNCYPTAETVRTSLNLTSSTYYRRISNLVKSGKLELDDNSTAGYRLPNYTYEQTKDINTVGLSSANIHILNMIVETALTKGYLPTMSYIADETRKTYASVKYHFNILVSAGIIEKYGDCTTGKSLTYSIDGLSVVRQAKNPIVNNLKYRVPEQVHEAAMMM